MQNLIYLYNSNYLKYSRYIRIGLSKIGDISSLILFKKSCIRVSHYSYDVHGNVKTLVQEIANKTLVKRLDYDYDLVSGKVNVLTYQANQSDQFIHKYEYDSDNRITKVFTSKDGVIWDNDAKYQYYAHGPLARTVIGENEVETQNNAYTLQGWIKGVNGQHFSYALGYNASDYSSINNTNLATPIATGKDLYNGNIATWTSKNTQLSAVSWTQQFEYDQLNRLKSGTTLGGTNAYKNTYSYDPNGNISALKRYDATGNLFDDLAYNYQNSSKGYKENTNHLRSVDDSSTDNPLRKDDLKDMGIDNYQYDEVGNLVFDEKEEIEKIEWTLAGNAKKITRTNKSNLEFDYDAFGNRVSKTEIPKVGIPTITYYVKNTLGITLATYLTDTKLEELNIYGNKRLGTLKNGERLYEIKDHLGSVRAIVSDNNVIKSASDYYPYGMIANSYHPTESKYGFSGKERQDELNSNDYDFGARFYSSLTGRWMSIDRQVANYPSVSPFVFALNKPIVATDPDGEVVIFINGFHPTSAESGTPKYWRNSKTGQNWDEDAMNVIGDHNALYKDGSMGAFLGTHFATNTNTDMNNRIQAGREAGAADAASIIAGLETKDGVIIESVKIVAHSMGVAFARGYVESLQAYVDAWNKTHPDDQILGFSIEYELDVAAFQGSFLPVNEKIVKTSNFMSGNHDIIATDYKKWGFLGLGDQFNNGDSGIPNSKQLPTKPGTTHTIFKFPTTDIPRANKNGTQNPQTPQACESEGKRKVIKIYDTKQQTITEEVPGPAPEK